MDDVSVGSVRISHMTALGRHKAYHITYNNTVQAPWLEKYWCVTRHMQWLMRKVPQSSKIQLWKEHLRVTSFMKGESEWEREREREREKWRTQMWTQDNRLAIPQKLLHKGSHTRLTEKDRIWHTELIKTYGNSTSTLIKNRAPWIVAQYLFSDKHVVVHVLEGISIWILDTPSGRTQQNEEKILITKMSIPTAAQE